LRFPWLACSKLRIVKRKQKNNYSAPVQR